MQIGAWISNVRNLAILYMGVLIIAACVVGGFLYITYYGNNYAETQTALNIDIYGFIDVYDFSENPEVALRRAVERRLESRDISSFYLLSDQNGNRITGNLHTVPGVMEDKDGDFVLFDIPYSDVTGNAPEQKDAFFPHYDVIAKTITVGDGMSLLVGRDVDAFQTLEIAIMGVIWITIALVCMMALIGFLMGAMILKRMRLIHQAADAVIETGRLSARIPAEHATGDFKPLADTFNTMLERIEDLVAGIRQVSDNIAHDLRTPLTRLNHHIETLKKGEGDVSIDDIADETNHIIKTFNALLRIANIEHGNRRSSFGIVDLRSLLNDLYEYYMLLAQKKNITLNIDLPEFIPNIMGDKDMLFQVFSNIIENSMKFTPEDGIITIQALNKDEKIHIVLTDTGSGIPDEDKAKVFRRFYRAEASRHTPGSGLGLALAKAVIDLHKAQIFLEDHIPCGLSVTVVFFNVQIRKLPVSRRSLRG
ncbi:HAMP domain-containing sensor histidine kinase [Thalassospira sp.]|uniref:HAMP domain-containing sensor histidine kinase n=1 Tax=Thalassospira sp. TaxID=1912094 RepID=UPI0027331903|nr:HAMP domain-containing sensor histidine kinase [Thalassospira sp.]MDP2699766.1 HAMP domain-containing sensor histidine kinase [Thalassospira sp.]